MKQSKSHHKWTVSIEGDYDYRPRPNKNVNVRKTNNTSPYGVPLYEISSHSKKHLKKYTDRRGVDDEYLNWLGTSIKKEY